MLPSSYHSLSRLIIIHPLVYTFSCHFSEKMTPQINKLSRQVNESERFLRFRMCRLEATRIQAGVEFGIYILPRAEWKQITKCQNRIARFTTGKRPAAYCDEAISFDGRTNDDDGNIILTYDPRTIRSKIQNSSPQTHSMSMLDTIHYSTLCDGRQDLFRDPRPPALPTTRLCTLTSLVDSDVIFSSVFFFYPTKKKIRTHSAIRGQSLL